MRSSQKTNKRRQFHNPQLTIENIINSLSTKKAVETNIASSGNSFQIGHLLGIMSSYIYNDFFQTNLYEIFKNLVIT